MDVPGTCVGNVQGQWMTVCWELRHLKHVFRGKGVDHHLGEVGGLSTMIGLRRDPREVDDPVSWGVRKETFL